MGLKGRIRDSLRRLFDAAAQPTVNSLQRDIKREALALSILEPLAPGHYLPWTRPALSPADIAMILNDITINGREQIAELGSGISTLFIGALLKQRGSGRLYSIEHDASWADIVRQMAARENLLDHVQLIVSPLQPVPSSLRPHGMWYDVETIRSALPPESIDLLIVDGPSSEGDDPENRFPALPFFHLYMQEERWAVFLDDANRAGGYRIMEKWSRDFGIDFKVVDGLAYSLQGKHYKILL